jgi:hypothetical protein
VVCYEESYIGKYNINRFESTPESNSIYPSVLVWYTRKFVFCACNRMILRIESEFFRSVSIYDSAQMNRTTSYTLGLAQEVNARLTNDIADVCLYDIGTKD